MLTIITGAPGAGKTCAMVSLAMELSKGRPIYADGVNGLTIEHEEINGREWHTTVPHGVGAAVIIDEGQRLWRPRGPGQRVPDDIAAMETHRHGGMDFFVTTQHPKLLDQNIRNLCGRHVHIRDLGVLGRWWYEWPEAADPGSWRSAPIKKRYKLDRKAFAVYKSASLHVKPVRSFPWMLIVLFASVVGVGVLSWMSYKAIKARLPGGQVEKPAKPVAAAPGPAGGPAGGIPSMSGQSQVVKASWLSDRSQFVPRFSSQPETAPAYDELRKLVVFPQVVGGYCQGDHCYCVTQQGTAAGVSDAECRVWLASPPFDPYRVPVPAAAAAVGVPVSVPQGKSAMPLS